MATQTVSYDIEQPVQGTPRSILDDYIDFDRQYISLDEKLYGAGGFIEDCRKELKGLRRELIRVEQRHRAILQAYSEEKNRNAQYAQFYHTLRYQHEQKLCELTTMAQNYRTLQRDFEDAQTSLLANDSVVQEYERRLAGERAQAVENEENAIGGDLNERISQLESENAELLNALANAAELVVAAQDARVSLTASSDSASPAMSSQDEVVVKVEEGANIAHTRETCKRKRSE
ncbi:hypothetical protein BDV96DRAFT_601184 [Lophiotrema nucula]|uniref:Uncharacterized protein n=1 Tax=Lophiotrema nucula TaxID=690887 RepID=A0A6A5Z3R0_9PLEO|nr:hypothetical protein BDV96DRAFT_601184 [Lophiotrema nucula]